MTDEHRAMIRGVMAGSKTAYRNFWRELFFPFGMLDEQGNPSLIRMGAVLVFIAGTHNVLAHDKPSTWQDFSILALGAFMTLGRMGMQMFRDWRKDTKQAATDAAKEIV